MPTRTAPWALTPIALPMLRPKTLIDVTRPRSGRSTALCIAMMNIVALRPIPAPSTTMSTNTVAVDAWLPRSASKANPAVSSAMPPIITGRYPVCSAIRPPTMLPPVQTTMNGISAAPAAVALVPRTPWTYSGIYATAPNMPTPIRNPPMEHTVTMRLSNRLNGRNGCSARISTRRKRMSNSALRPASPAVWGDAQGNSRPPQNRSRSSAIALPDTRPTPA